jgi:hypothetical protein
MFNFFSKKRPPAKLADDELRLKAAGVNFAIFTISNEITKNLQKEVKNLNKLKQEEINNVFFCGVLCIVVSSTEILLGKFYPRRRKCESL